MGDVFQQALRNKWIESRAEFDIPRPKPKPKEEPAPDLVCGAARSVRCDQAGVGEDFSVAVSR